MIRRVKYLLFAFVLILVQTQVLDLLSLRGITPDILTIWIVYIALKHGQLSATLWGFIIGIMFDLVTGYFVGLSALTKTLTGFIAGYFFEENKATVTLGSYRYILIIFIVSLFHNTVYFIAFSRGSDIGIFQAIFEIGVATTFYTTALGLLAMFAFARKYIT